MSSASFSKTIKGHSDKSY